MKKLVSAILIAVVAMAANAQEFKYSGQLRSRAYIYNLDLNKNADNQNLERKVDLRFRPMFEYKVNEQFKAVWRAEIGDITFGDKATANPGKSSGGAQGTDGVNVETKSLYLDYTPVENQKVTLGLQGWADPMVMFVDDDFAGISYEGKFDAITAKAAWLISEDNGEFNKKEEIYSYGKSNFGLDLSYSADKTMKFGVNALIQASTAFHKNIQNTKKTADSIVVNNNSTGLWLAPYAQMNLMDSKLKIDGEFAYFSRSGELENAVVPDGYTSTDKVDDESGMALFLKTAFKATEQFTVGANFLYASGTDKTDKKEFYNAPTYLSKETTTGLEILGNNGSNDGVGFSPAAKGAQYGVMLPVLHGAFAIDKQYSVGAAFGYAMTAAEYKDKKDKAQTGLGMEFDINGSIKLGDKLSVTPYAAFFMPADGLQVLKKNSTTEYETAPMQKEIGFKAEIKF